MQMRLDGFEIDADSEIIIGGDFNVILDYDSDGFGGKPKLKISCKKIENLGSSFDLIDIWRIKNPESKRFTWKQGNPPIQRRLDVWLISSKLKEEIDDVDIVPEIKTDHSTITLHVNGIDETAKGPSCWKFNASLLEDERYVALINEKYDKWLEDWGVEIQDPRVLWDFIKCKIRNETITYNKQVAKERSEKLPTLERNIQEYAMKCDKDRTSENLNNLEVLQTEYDRQYDSGAPNEDIVQNHLT